LTSTYSGILNCDFGILNWDLDSLWGSSIRTWRGRQSFALGKAGDGENNLSSIAQQMLHGIRRRRLLIAVDGKKNIESKK
jgi:hypothetical protein